MISAATCTRPWEPLLEGPLRASAEAALLAIASELPHPAPGLGFSVAGGNAGMAVLFAYLAQWSPGAGHEDRAEAHLDQALAALGRGGIGPELFSGLAGVAWALEHLQGRLFEPGDEDPNADADEALLDFVSRRAEGASFDLIRGVAGVGLYGLARAHRPSGRALVAAVVQRLGATAAPMAPGLTWHSAPGTLAPWEREIYPKGYYNLGVSHGIPAVIAVLAGACARGVAVEAARPLLDGAVAWLLAQENGPGPASCFASVLPFEPTGREADPSAQETRVAWCYGDLGLSLALLSAARAVEEPAWEAQALRFARRAAARPVEEAKVNDAGLCHGAAGNGHLFNRLYRATGEPCFGAAARTWFEEALRYRRPGQGYGGFQSWFGGNAPGEQWVTEASRREGSTGIALGLLSAVAPLGPAWDQLLLGSLPGYDTP